MTQHDPDPLTLMVEAAIIQFGVPMQPEWRASVLANFTTVALAAQFVAGFALDDEAEYAPVFHP